MNGRDAKALKVFRKVVRVLGWLVLSVVVFLLVLAGVIQIPAVQNKLTQKAIGFLESKIKTDVRLEHISLSFPKKVVLSGLYLEDEQKDTLLYAGELAVDTDLWGLARNRIQLNQVTLRDVAGFVKRPAADSVYNFDYIIKAFTDTAAVVDTTAKPWDFTIGDILIENTRVSFDDRWAGSVMSAVIGSAEVNVDEFDLNNSIIHIDDVLLERTHVSVQVLPPSGPSKPATRDAQPDTAGLTYDIRVVDIELEDVYALYDNQVEGQRLQVSIPEAIVEADEMDLRQQFIHLDEFSLVNSVVVFEQRGVRKAPAAAQPDTAAAVNPWKIRCDGLLLAENTIRYDDFSQPHRTDAVDFNHLGIQSLSMEASDVHYNASTMRGGLESLAFKEQSGFEVKSLETDFVLTDKNLRAEDFHFVTGHSEVDLQLRASFDSLSALAKPGTSLSLAINPSNISLRDVFYFMPSLADSLPVQLSPETTVHMNAAVEGTVGDLTVEFVNVETLDNTILQASGKVRGLPDLENAVMDIALEQFHTVRTDVRAVLPDSMMPSSIAIPEWIHLSGQFKGSPRKPDIRTILTSDYGAVHANAKLDLRKNRSKPTYTGAVDVRKFDIGTLLKQPQTMGTVSMKASVKGAGFAMEDLDAQLRAVVSEFTYQRYTYRNLRLDGTVKKYLFAGHAALDDKNLSFEVDADLDYNVEVPRYKVTLDLENANLQALNLAERPLRMRATLDIDVLTSDFTIINGDLAIRKVAVYNGDALYAVDSMLVASVDQEGQSEITLRSDIVTGDFKGTINLFSLPDVVKRHVNQYFSLRDAVYKKPAAEQNFSFDLVLKNTDLLTEVLLPDLEPFVPGKISGAFNSVEDRLDLHLSLTRFQYASIRMDSVLFEVNSNPEALTYAFRLRDIGVDTLRMEALRIDGAVANDSIRTTLTILDSLQETKYALGGVFHSFEKNFRFRFLPGKVMLKYQDWEVPADNHLDFSRHGLVPHHFEVTRGEEKLAVVRKHERDSVVSILFNRFDLENITSIVEGTVPVDGLIDGDFNLGVAAEGAFNSTLYVHEFTVFKHAWGDLALQLGRTATGPYNIDVRLEGEKAEVKAAGYYTSKLAAPEIYFKTEITKLDLSILEPLTMQQLEKMEGQLTGEVLVEGKAAQPQIDGALTFTKASLVPSALKSKFTLEDETITVKRSGLSFRDFEIRDAANHVAELRGDIRTTTFTEFDLDLQLFMRDFQVLNSTEDDNELFYGKVGITTTARIQGTSNLPRIEMNVNITDDSEFTYVVPQSDKGVIDQKGIVVFVDKDAKTDPFLAAISKRDTAKATFRGIDLSANIELTDKETFNIVIDPATGDKLSVKGNSTLTLTMDPSGDMQLSGRYEVSEGMYELSFYRLVKRSFSIQKGGTITWAGDPLAANMELRALYEVETSPMELVSNQLTTNNAQELNMYKQRLPFLVYLNIKGELLAPEVSFEIDMPESKRNAFGGSVYARIQDINTRESDLNKQVFALLVLKRFISDNPFDSQGSDVAATARRSVSKLLTEQLNRLSENVKGVELSFDVKSYEDYSTGQAQGQTELQLGVSKSLFSDRLVVKVSGNLDLEGETSRQNSFTDYIGDLALEYKLTEDGRFRITGFRNSNYDMIDGDLIETGAGLIYIKDYNALRELFKANEKEK